MTLPHPLPHAARRATLAVALLLARPGHAQSSHHEGTFGGVMVRYTAAVEATVVANAAGRPAARIVSTAYTADGADATTRPILFVCNGGPIGPSWPLHMLALGPRRLAIPADLSADSTKFPLVDNGYTVLDAADIVFYDPAGTGWSRLLPGIDPESYYSVEADAQQMAAFITTWTRRHGRERSPIYLLGESYATIRVPETARILAHGKTPRLVDGMMLMGQAVNQLEINTRPHNILAYVVGLPSVAATAWYHKKVDAGGLSVHQWMEEAFRFGREEYLTALYRGHTLSSAERERIATRLAQLTGIPAEYYLAHDLRITRTTYMTEILKDRGLKLGWDDGRYVGPAAGGAPDAAAAEAASGALMRYLRSELGVTRTDTYRRMQPDPPKPYPPGYGGWAYGPDPSPFADFPWAASITELMNANPRFRLLIGSGIYDLKTTTGAARYLVDQLGWPADRVRFGAYEGGHMAYTNESALAEFTAQVRELVKGTR